MLLSTAYFPPVSWFAALASEFTLSASEDGVSLFPVHIEACESYVKQTWRNRCTILSANGPLSLSFPVVHNGEDSIAGVRVDYSVPWVAKTEKAVESAYDSSPFFEYYRDGIFGILESRPQTLWELNLRLIRHFVERMGLPVRLVPTEEFTVPGACAGTDHRYDITPKRPDTILASLGLEKPYYQVFAQKYGFTPNLSIMDLLFNMGPESILYIKNL